MRRCSPAYLVIKKSVNVRCKLVCDKFMASLNVTGKGNAVMKISKTQTMTYFFIIV